MPDDPKFSEELKKMEYEPLLAVEKKLIAGSLLLGVLLLGLLIWLSNKFFPASGDSSQGSHGDRREHTEISTA
jgi:hypothetical protein